MSEKWKRTARKIYFIEVPKWKQTFTGNYFCMMFWSPGNAKNRETFKFVITTPSEILSVATEEFFEGLFDPLGQRTRVTLPMPNDDDQKYQIKVLTTAFKNRFRICHF